jgi:hypothetical protein
LLDTLLTEVRPPEEGTTMDENRRDKTKVDPLTGGEEKEPAQPLQTVPEGATPNATSAVIPGSGVPVEVAGDKDGKRVVDT